MALLALGLAVLTFLALLVATASRTTLIVVEQALSQYWRTTYDILVRPAGSRLPVEQKYGLVEANSLARIPGGISYEQYEAVKAIPGVQVAAPVAMLAYLWEFPDLPSRSSRPQPGIYLLQAVTIVDEGVRVIKDIGRRYYYFGPPTTAANVDPRIGINEPVAEVARPLYLLMAAVDPGQEAALVGLDRAVVEGNYLKNPDRWNMAQDSSLFAGQEETVIYDVPALIHRRSFAHFTVTNRLMRVLLPDGVTTLDEVLSRGGVNYLDALPKETVHETTIESQSGYQVLLDRVWGTQSDFTLFQSLGTLWRPRGRTYREVPTPFLNDGPAFEALLMPLESGNGSQVSFEIKASGLFDVEHVPRPPEVNRVPMELYLPPVATLRYDEAGNPVEPRQFRPEPGPGSYILSPPLILTTLEAARLITGDDCASCISAIRVRVALEGCPGDYLSCPLTPENQRKIETVASEIARLTGLDVDIVVGSSPTRVLVHIPGVGWVEEQWIQKNVTLTYKERVQLGHLLLLGTLLVVGALFTLDLAWAEVVARRRLIALQKALGWRSRTVFRQVLGEVLLAATPAAALGALAARGLSALFGWQPLPLSWLVGVPLVVVALALLGGLYPARAAARIPPALGVRPGEPFPGRPGRRASRQGGLLTYAWQGLGRRRSRTALGALTAALSAALLVLMLAVTVDRQGALSGTLLGEFILVRLEAHHYALVAMGFLLAGLSLGNSLLAAVLERRREIGVLKAVGWRTGTVVRLFLAEGALLGLLGGAAGALAGAGAFVGLYRALPLSLVWIMAVGVALPVSVGMLAALYPARVAARVPPAEVVRYE